MLLWLQRKQAQRLTVFKLKLFFLVFIFHFFILFIGLFINFDEALKFEIRNDNKVIPFVLLPFQKKVPGALKGVKINRKLLNVNKTVPQVKKTSQSSVKLNVENTKKEIKVPKIKINENKTKDKIEADKRIKNIKKLKSDVIKEEKVEPIKENIKVEEVSKSVNNNEVASQIVDSNAQNTRQDVVYIGRQDLEQLRMEELIENEIKSHWKPPAGLSKDLKCSIKTFINNDGKATNIQILQSSKSIAFDLSIKRDLSKAVFCKELWMKEIILNYSGSD